MILHDLSAGTEKQLFAELRVRPEGFEWAPDNSGFYMATPFSTDARFMTAGITIVYFYDVASGASTQVNLDSPNGLGFDLQTVPGGFVALLAAGSHDDLAFYSAAKGAAGWSWKREAIAGEHAKNLESFRVSEDGNTAREFCVLTTPSLLSSGTLVTRALRFRGNEGPADSDCHPPQSSRGPDWGLRPGNGGG